MSELGMPRIEVRGELGSIATTLSGVRFCDNLPRTASLAGWLAIVLSMNHWPWEFSTVLAGISIRGDQVVGVTSCDDGEVQDRLVSHQDLLTAVNSCLGVDSYTPLYDGPSVRLKDSPTLGA